MDQLILILMMIILVCIFKQNTLYPNLYHIHHNFSRRIRLLYKITLIQLKDLIISQNKYGIHEIADHATSKNFLGKKTWLNLIVLSILRVK